MQLEHIQRDGLLHSFSLRARHTLISYPCFGLAPCRENVFAYMNNPVTGEVSAGIHIPYTCRTNESSSNRFAYVVRAETQKYWEVLPCLYCFRDTPPVFSPCLLYATSGFGKRETRIGWSVVTCESSTRYWNYLEDYWPCAGKLSAVNVIDTQLTA